MIQVEFDGGYQPLSGGLASIGVVIYKDNALIKEISQKIGAGDDMTNNVAEYVAAKTGLEFILEKGWQGEAVKMCGDSQLVIQQMKGLWNIKSGAYAPVARETKSLASQFTKLSWHWISRDKNKHADQLS